MKILGIVGGIAPGSTIEYYRQIIDLYRERNPDGSYPPIIINSIDLQKMLDLISSDRIMEVTEYLTDEVGRLARAGADFGLLASNTPHIVFDEIQRRSAIPLISIVEAASAAVQALGLERVGLFGTRFTMQGRFFPDMFSQRGIGLSIPEIDDQDYVHDKYMNELIKGIFRDETRDHLLGIVDRMIGQDDIQGLILGGTELPLILKEDQYRGIPFLDTTRIHVERAVTGMLS